MNHVLLAVVTVALAGHAPVGHTQNESALVGLWLGEARTEGGLGNWIEFRPDGTLRFAFGAMVEGTYRLEGTSLRVRAVGEPAESPAADITINDATAIRRRLPPADAPARDSMSADDRAILDRMTQPITMTRVGRATAGAPPIVGTWSYTHSSGAPAYETFTRTGRFVLRVRMQESQGTYAEGPSRIDVTLPSGKSEFQLNGDVLMSGSMDGKHSTFRRAPTP